MILSRYFEDKASRTIFFDKMKYEGIYNFTKKQNVISFAQFFVSPQEKLEVETINEHFRKKIESAEDLDVVERLNQVFVIGKKIGKLKNSQKNYIHWTQNKVLWKKSWQNTLYGHIYQKFTDKFLIPENPQCLDPQDPANLQKRSGRLNSTAQRRSFLNTQSPAAQRLATETRLGLENQTPHTADRAQRSQQTEKLEAVILRKDGSEQLVDLTLVVYESRLIAKTPLFCQVYLEDREDHDLQKQEDNRALINRKLEELARRAKEKLSPKPELYLALEHKIQNILLHQKLTLNPYLSEFRLILKIQKCLSILHAEITNRELQVSIAIQPECEDLKMLTDKALFKNCLLNVLKKFIHLSQERTYFRLLISRDQKNVLSFTIQHTRKNLLQNPLKN